MKNAIYIVLLICLNIGCYDSTLVQKNGVTVPVSITVYDKNNNPAKNSRINIDGESNVISSNLSNGVFSAQLKEGYNYVKVYIFDKNVFFTTYDSFYLVGGLDFKKEYWPYKERGKLDIKIVSYNQQPIQNINVAVLPVSSDNKGIAFYQLEKKFYSSDATDNIGRIKFLDLPLHFNFDICVFSDSTRFFIPLQNYIATLDSSSFIETITVPF